MDNKHINRLYDLHKNDSDDKLQNISNNSNRYSQESVFVANQILQERGSVVNNSNEPNNKIYYVEKDIATILESIKRNTDTIRNILIFFIAITIIGIILIIVN